MKITWRIPVAAALLAWCTSALGEQKVVLADHEVHYIVLPTTFLKPAIANDYDLPRGKDRALVNVSIIGPDGTAVAAQLTGESKNLLGQIQNLEFRQVTERPAIYYLALIRHGNEETHRIRITVTLKTGESTDIAFQQKLYWEN